MNLNQKLDDLAMDIAVNAKKSFESFLEENSVEHLLGSKIVIDDYSDYVINAKSLLNVLPITNDKLKELCQKGKLNSLHKGQEIFYSKIQVCSLIIDKELPTCEYKSLKETIKHINRLF